MLCAYARARGDRPFYGLNSFYLFKFFNLDLPYAPEKERGFNLGNLPLGTDVFAESSPDVLKCKSILS